MKKIITTKSKSVNSRLATSSKPKVSIPLNAKKQQEEGNTWIVWIIAIVFIVAIGTALGMSASRQNNGTQSRTSGKPDTSSRSTRKNTPPQEKLWMGDYMKKSGTISNEVLMARQERVSKARVGKLPSRPTE